MRARLPAIALVALVLTAAGCSSDDTSSTTVKATTPAASATAATKTASSTPPVGSASSELCDAREALRTSITDLASVDVVKNGTSAIKDQLTTIQQNLKAVRSSAGSDVQPQVDAFQTSLDSLQSAVDSSAPVQAVSALRDVASTGATLLTSLGNLQCS